MFSRLGLKFALFLLKSGRLDMESANICTTAILDSLQALPFYDIIKVDDNQQLIINDKPLDIEQARRLRESAIAALDNVALKIVREQVAYLAVIHGIHKAETIPQLFWGRVGIWWFQNETRLLELLAQRIQEPNL